MERILKRKITQEIEDWWKSGDKPPFLLLGARQTGKTKTISLFIENKILPNHSCKIDFIK
jgi:predicted AAA+ superfamily ATPase